MDSCYFFGNVDCTISLPSCPSVPSSCRVYGAQVPTLHPCAPSVPPPSFPQPLTGPCEVRDLHKRVMFLRWTCTVFQNHLPQDYLQIHTFTADFSSLLWSPLLGMFNSNFPTIPYGFKVYEEDGFLWGKFLERSLMYSVGF